MGSAFNPGNPFAYLRNTGNQTHFRSAPGMYKRRRSARRGPVPRMPRKMRGYYRRSGYYRGSRSAPMYASGELKFADGNLDLVAGDRSAGIALKTFPVGIAEGGGESDRNGRKIILKSLYIDLHVQRIASASTAVAGAVSTRLVLVQDTQCNGVVTAWASVFDAPGTNRFTGVRNLANIERFKVLMDKRVVFNTTAAAWDGTTVASAGADRLVRKYLKLNMPIIYSGATGAQAEIASNNLTLLVVNDDSSSTIDFSGTFRLRYIG